MSNTLLRRAVRTALAAGAVASMAQAPAVFAQSSEEDDVKDLDRVQVTGSRLTRADIETAQPVTVIDRDDIDLSGDTTVAEVLQTSVFNSLSKVLESKRCINKLLKNCIKVKPHRFCLVHKR